MTTDHNCSTCTYWEPLDGPHDEGSRQGECHRNSPHPSPQRLKTQSMPRFTASTRWPVHCDDEICGDHPAIREEEARIMGRVGAEAGYKLSMELAEVDRAERAAEQRRDLRNAL